MLAWAFACHCATCRQLVTGYGVYVVVVKQYPEPAIRVMQVSLQYLICFMTYQLQANACCYCVVAAQIELEKAEKPVVFKLPQPEPLRYQGPLLQLREVSFKYPGGSSTSSVLRDVVMSVDMSSRIGLLGMNGAGKTTLMSLIAGTVSPTRGSIERYGALSIGMFTQHIVESLQLDKTPLSQFQALDPTVGEQALRDYLGGFGVHGKTALTPLQVLSGGQKSRVALATILRQRPHILLLDEPTNHLDMDSIEALSGALQSYSGGLVLVSHDVRFMSEVCEELWLVEGGTVTRFEGGVEVYAEKILKKARRQKKKRLTPAVAGAAAGAKPATAVSSPAAASKPAKLPGSKTVVKKKS